MDTLTNEQAPASAIRFSHGLSKYDNKPAQIEAATAEEFIEYVSKCRASEKGKDYLAAPFNAGQHDDPPKHPGTHKFRLKRLAAASRFMAFDIDGVSSPEIAKALLQALNEYLGLAYTTASHTDEHPRFRAILITQREMEYNEREKASESLEAKLALEVAAIIDKPLSDTDIKFDRSVYRSEQPCYLPIVGAKLKRLKGQEVDVDDLMAGNAAIGAMAGNLPIEFNLHRTSLPETAEHIEQVRSALAAIPAARDAGCDYECWRNVLWAVASTELSCAKDLAKTWSRQSPADFNAADFERTWASYNPAKDRCITVGTLFHIAQQHGYVPPDLQGLDAFAHTDTGNARRFAQAFNGHLKFVHGLDAWLYWSPAEARWVCCLKEEQIEFAKKFAEQMLMEVKE